MHPIGLYELECSGIISMHLSIRGPRDVDILNVIFYHQLGARVIFCDTTIRSLISEHP